MLLLEVRWAPPPILVTILHSTPGAEKEEENEDEEEKEKEEDDKDVVVVPGRWCRALFSLLPMPSPIVLPPPATAHKHREAVLTAGRRRRHLPNRPRRPAVLERYNGEFSPAHAPSLTCTARRPFSP